MPNKINLAVAWALDIARDNSHGYDQINRWGPDYDCSSLVIAALEQAGIPAKTSGATYTGNMRRVLLALGFIDVTSQVTLKTGAGIQYGDVLLHDQNHTAFALGNNQLVHASRNEQGKAVGGQTGDQDAKEIVTRDYYNYPWQIVLRYPEDNTDKKSIDVIAQEVIDQKWDNGDARKAKLAAAGYDYDTVQARVNQILGVASTPAVAAEPALAVDGDRGPATITRLQKVMGTTADGKISKPSVVVKAYQRYLNSAVAAVHIRNLTGAEQLAVDGVEGPKTYKVLQFWLFNSQNADFVRLAGHTLTAADFDGDLGKTSVSVWQIALNKAAIGSGKF